MNHRRRLRSSTCLSAAALLCMLPQLALANPQDGVVSAGQASIASSGNTLTVNQTSNKAVIDWRGFDIGAGETTQFVQPGSSSIALNRVNSNNASHIDGNLTANGNVIIVNQNGVLFGQNAKVDVNGLVASTADIDTTKFMNSTGALTFDKAGNPNAVIANAGQITAKEAGLVGLVAPNVINSGVITAKLGRVHLASGDAATVDLYGDGLMDVAVSDAVQSQLVANRGLISADGGTVALTAAAGRDIINSLIDQSGALQAQSVDVKNGKIVIAAEGSNSKIKFSGTAKANGNTHGNGGKVTVIGKGDVDFTGTVEAMGGTQSGDGGFVETSGHTLSVSGNVNASASNGNAGTWLLDPATINIITGGSSSSLTASSIDPSYIVSSLNGTNITLTADESITVTNAIDASGNASAGNLTLNAPTAFLNAAITLKSGSILSGNPSTVNVSASGKVQNGVDVAAANAIVNLSPATYALANQILIGKSLTLNGHGAILDGQNATRVMEIDGTVGGVTVNLNKLTMANGNGVGANSSGSGGGLLIFAESGNRATVNINNSAFYNNSATTLGGAIYNDGSNSGNATLTVNNSTISGNSVAGSYGGGGIFNDGYNNGNATLTVTNSTISGNSVTGSGFSDGGGIHNWAYAGTATTTIENTILAGNTLNGSESDYAGFSGATLNSSGHNLFGQNGNAGGFTGNGTTDILLTGNINTVLSALADNGGPTKTMALVSGSAAIGAGGTNSGYQIDQRGLARALSGQISIGAYEYAPVGNPFIITSTVDPSSNSIGTLRTAFNYVNANPFFNPTITFDSYFDIARTISLAQGQLLISGNMTLDGPWSGLTLDAHNASRVMQINGSTTGVNVTLDRLTLENGNTANEGGGLWVNAENGTHASVAINNSAILNNSANQQGGGIFNDGQNGGNATLTINNSTLSGNTETNSNGGGAIYNSARQSSGSAKLTITNSTISGNSVGSGGSIGGIYNDGYTGSAVVLISDTILAGNTNSSAESDYMNFNGGTLTSLGYNLFGQNGNAGGFTGNGTTDILLTGAINTVLSTLADNGGSTKTMALVSGSAAIGAGGATTPYALDQRGFARALTGNIDIGAYEYNAVNPFLVTSTADQSGLVLGTLRTAFDYANHTLLNPTISFDTTAFAAPQTISLVNGQFLISSSLTLNGSNAGVTLDAHNASRVMEIDGTTTGVNVMLDRLTLTGGNGFGANQNGQGGALAIYSENGNHATVSINNSTISGNSAGYSGGGIYNDGNQNGNAILTINNSTISGNSAVGYGGAIMNDAENGGSSNAILTISNSTISGNSAGYGYGGGIFNWIYSNGGVAKVAISDSILAGNTNGSGAEIYSNGTLTSLGHNLFGQNGNAGGFVGNGTTDILLTGAINTVLSALADNGGPTKTMALVSGSAAIGAGSATTPYALDQRNFARALSGNIDIGAYEYNAVHPFLVTSAADQSGLVLGTLRTAFDYANHTKINPTISFDATAFAAPQTISLVNGQFVISSSLTLNGSNAGVTLDAHNASRVMEIDGTSSGTTVELSNLSFINGNAGSFGGAIYIVDASGQKSTVTINNSTLANNTANGGGAITVDSGIYGPGGKSILNINNSTLSGNISTYYGGAIWNVGDTGGNAILNISNSTIANNTSASIGGAILNDGRGGNAILTISNSTISGNIDNSGVGWSSGGILQWGTTKLILSNSILAGNIMSGDESDFNVNDGTFTSLGYNLFGQNGNAGGFTGNGTTDILLTGSINSVLSALADNGGPTQTMALVVGSAAYKAGGAVGAVTTDQRGNSRGSTISIGAYDYAPVSLVVNSIADTVRNVIGGAVTTLRDALYYSNIGAIVNPNITFDGTVFNSAKTISLAQGQLLINSSLTVNGTVYGVTLDAQNTSRVMEIDGTSGGITVNLNKLTLENGNGVGGNRSGYFGGALLVYTENSNQATVNIDNSTIINSNADYGGGIFNDGLGGSAALTISNTTITANDAYVRGAAVYNYGTGGYASLSINNSTISGNNAILTGGGLVNDQSGGTVLLAVTNSILSNNTANGSESDYTIYNSGGTLTSLGHNLFGQSGSAGGFVGNGTTDILLTGGINTVLSALADNQGPTKTMALVTGSAAYLAGGANSGGQLDQRGDVRGSTISIGAWDTSYRPASLVVDTTADTIGDAIIGQETHMSLRDALFYANAGALTNPTITFDATVFATPQTITLAHGQFVINHSLTVDGSVYGVTLDAHNASRVMEIDGTSGGITVGLNRLTLENGNGVGTNDSGYAGGLLIYAENNTQAAVNITNSTISGNSAAQGGGIYNSGQASGNSSVTINGSTITGNTAFYGGGLLNVGTQTTSITNSTISNNTGIVEGGGIYTSAGTLNIGNSILANNTNSNGESDHFTLGVTTSLGYNLFGQNGNAGGFVGNGTTDILLTGNINSVLSALADNSGPTKTMALKLGSVAIDAGDPSQISQLDQRGFTRGSSGAGTGTHADIGAYEAAILNVSADDQEIIYGQSAPSLTYTLNSGPTGHLGGNLAFITNYTNVGTYAGDIGIGTLAPNNGYLMTFTAGQYKIDPRTVTIIPIVGQSKIYGSVDSTLFYNTATASGSTGLVNSDTLSGSINYSSAGQYTNVGNYAFTLGNLSNSNYSIVMAGSPPTFAINARTVTIAANAQSATYGDTLGSLNYATSGLVGSDVFTGSLTTAHGGAGTVLTHANGVDVTGSPFAITQGSLAINDGNGGNNYAINYTGNNVTLAAKAATVTAEAASRNQGAANPTFAAIISGFVGGETLGTSGVTGTPDFTTLANGSSVAGEYAITPSLGTLAANNYSFSPFIDGVLTVTPFAAIPSSVLRVSQNPEILSGNSGNRWDAPDVTDALNDAHHESAYLPTTAPLSLQNRLRYWLDSMHGLLTIDPELAHYLGIANSI